MPADVADDAAVSHAVESTLRATEGHELALTAEAPVSWPSGAFVRVDRLTNEARACIERSAEFAADRLARPHDSPLRALAAGRVPRGRRSTRTSSSASSASTPTRAFRDVQPPVENVPPALRMRVGGLFLSEVGGHWRDLLRARELVPELSFTFDTSHAGLFRSSRPRTLACSASCRTTSSSSTAGSTSSASTSRSPTSRTRTASSARAPVRRRRARPRSRRVAPRPLGPLPRRRDQRADPARSPDMKAAYGRSSAPRPARPRRESRSPRRLEPDPSTGRPVGRRDPVPSLLELQERYGGRSILLTGGAGSIGSALTTPSQASARRRSPFSTPTRRRSRPTGGAAEAA